MDLNSKFDLLQEIELIYQHSLLQKLCTKNRHVKREKKRIKIKIYYKNLLSLYCDSNVTKIVKICIC